MSNGHQDANEYGKFRGRTEASLKGLARSVDSLRDDQKEMAENIQQLLSEVRFLKGQSSILGAVFGAVAAIVSTLWR